jgi:hypothetical protein
MSTIRETVPIVNSFRVSPRLDLPVNSFYLNGINRDILILRSRRFQNPAIGGVHENDGK